MQESKNYQNNQNQNQNQNKQNDQKENKKGQQEQGSAQNKKKSGSNWSLPATEGEPKFSALFFCYKVAFLREI